MLYQCLGISFGSSRMRVDSMEFTAYRVSFERMPAVSCPLGDNGCYELRSNGAAALGLAVMLGAFGAHALRDRLDAYSMGVYEKAVFYHFVHALGILIVSSMPKIGALSQNAANWVCGLLLAGVLIFSGS